MSEQKARMLAGELYHADNPDLRAGAERCDRLLRRFNIEPDVQQRHAILRELLGSVGDCHPASWRSATRRG